MAALLDIMKKGSTDRSVTIRIFDSGDGTPETGVVFDTSGIDLWYRREGAAKVSITEADLATPALTDAHADGGFLHIGDGEYRLDLPDAALATGANHVDIGGTVTGMVVIGGRVRLVDYDPEDAVRMGQTALPNAAAGAAGGLPVSAAGSLDLDAKLAATNEITAARMGALTDWLDGGRLDLIIDAINGKTTNLPGDPAGQSQITDAANAILAVLGTPADTDFATDIAAVKAVDDAIKAVTDLLVAAHSEPTGVPAANETPLVKLAYLFMALRNALLVSDTKKQFYNDAGTVEWEKDIADDGFEYTESEGNAP